MLPLRIARGKCLPLGASALPDGVNFALLCRHGTDVTLVAVSARQRRAARRVRAGPQTQPHRRSLAHPGRRPAAGFHVRLARRWPAKAGTSLRSHPSSCSIPSPPLSPMARTGANRTSRTVAAARRAAALFCAGPFTGARTLPPLTPLEDTIIYELHVRGFTCHPSSVRRASRHLRRPDREDSVPASAGHHRRRTAAHPRVRRERLSVSSIRTPASGCATSGATTASPSPPPRRPTPARRRSTAR